MARLAGKRKKKRRRSRSSSSVSDQVITISDFGQSASDDVLGFTALSAGVALPAVLWSAVNPGFAALKSAARKPIDRGNAVQGLWIGLGLSVAVSAGLYYFMRRPITAFVGGATSLALFAIGMSAINSVPVEANGASQMPSPKAALPATKLAPV